ncbi:MAG: HisA/HisF-related TIM barrel protein [Pseudomonadota bacterium]|nr:HisA/HisF-related TIM barrel protein [Pseudomonadota bacterium]
MIRRIIPVLFAMDGHLVRSEKFNWHQRLGNLVAQVERYSQWDLDELIYIDISRSRDDNSSYDSEFADFVQLVADVCRMPLTFGGGIKSVRDAELLFENGADKVVVSSAAIDNPALVESLAKRFGTQAVCISLDVNKIGADYILTSRCSSKIHSDLEIGKWIEIVQGLGCGELFINPVHKDGSADGYDLTLAKIVLDAASVPVILCGGVGSPSDFENALRETDASALAAGNFFNFRELSYPMLKRQLLKNFDTEIREWSGSLS